MKQSDLRIAVYLTIISFALITLQWNILPVDAPDSEMYGFPLPYSCNAWHTSLARQYFLLEFFIDILCYFIFWTVCLLFLKKLNVQIFSKRIIGYVLLFVAGIFLILSLILAFMFENTFQLKRDFDFETESIEVRIL